MTEYFLCPWCVMVMKPAIWRVSECYIGWSIQVTQTPRRCDFRATPSFRGSWSRGCVPKFPLEAACRPAIGHPESQKWKSKTWGHIKSLVLRTAAITAALTYTTAPPGLRLCQFPERGRNQRSSMKEVSAAWESITLMQKIIFNCGTKVWHTIYECRGVLLEHFI